MLTLTLSMNRITDVIIKVMKEIEQM